MLGLSGEIAFHLPYLKFRQDQPPDGDPFFSRLFSIYGFTAGFRHTEDCQSENKDECDNPEIIHICFSFSAGGPVQDRFRLFHSFAITFSPPMNPTMISVELPV